MRLASPFQVAFLSPGPASPLRFVRGLIYKLLIRTLFPELSAFLD